MSRRRKILLLQPSLQPPGGGNGVAAWMIEALKSDYAVSVLTCWPIDLAAVNRYYGTALTSTDFTAHRFPFSLLYRLLERIPLPLSLIKTSLLLWQGKQIQSGYDLVISGTTKQTLVVKAFSTCIFRGRIIPGRRSICAGITAPLPWWALIIGYALASRGSRSTA
jgi:hypothetical protein